MRELTESERVAMEKAWNKNFNDEPALSFYDSLEAGFAAALNHSDKQIAVLTAELDSLRAALPKDTNQLKRLVKAWRDEAAGHYCQTYNTGQAKGLTVAANMLEDYVKQARRALDKSKPTTKGEPK